VESSRLLTKPMDSEEPVDEMVLALC
jgi:hypothetical protein